VNPKLRQQVQELYTAYMAYKRHFFMAAQEQWLIHRQQMQLNGYSSQAAGFSRAAGVQQGYGESPFHAALELTC
jgi:hypothetical protein